MLMAINYGKGRVFHTTLGHSDESMEDVGFVTTSTAAPNGPPRAR